MTAAVAVDAACRPGRPGALLVLLLGSTLTVMAGAVLSPVLAVIRDELGLSGTAAGLVLTAHGLAIAVVSPAVGWWMDRVGVRGPLAAGLLVYGLAGGAGLVLDSYPVLIASRVMLGPGPRPFSPAPPSRCSASTRAPNGTGSWGCVARS